MKKTYKFLIWMAALGLFAVGSCTSTKNIPYFTNLDDSLKHSRVPHAAFTDPVIQPDAIMSINSQTIDPGATAAVNQQSIREAVLGPSSAGNLATREVRRILVDP